MKKILKDNNGVAMTEFAISLPFFIGVGMYGVEISNMAITNMAVSQVALNLSDNASRLGQTNGGIVTPSITENDILQVFAGTRIQGRNLDLLENGRVILSSLEVNPGNDQVIRWQRCKGLRTFESAYGPEGINGTDDASFLGMGQTGQEVVATTDTAVMFVEIEYRYQPLFGTLFFEERVFSQEAAFNIRDDRNLEAGLVVSTDPVAPPATCDLFDAT